MQVLTTPPPVNNYKNIRDLQLDIYRALMMVYIPREQLFALAIFQQPNLPLNPEDEKIFSIDYPVKVSADVAVNKNR